MSTSSHDDDTTKNATTIRASKGGSGGKVLTGGLVAVLLAAGGYFAWQNYSSTQPNTQTASNDPYAPEPVQAGPLPAQNSATESTPAPSAAAPTPAVTQSAATHSATPTRHASAHAVREETIGITPVSATSDESADENVIVHGSRQPLWTRMPSAQRLSQYYPERALDRRREGEASLQCTVLEGGALNCTRVSETPGGFGYAALRLSETLRHSPQFADGSDAIGEPVNLHVVFRLPPDYERG